MLARETCFSFQSPLGPWMTAFISEKRALGFRYETEHQVIARLDRHLCSIGLESVQLSRETVEQWTAVLPHEKPESQAVRVRLVRQFAQYLRNRGIEAYTPTMRMAPVGRSTYTPYIFTHHQITSLLGAADRLRATGHSPIRHVVMPEIFRLLYGSGLRLNEALCLSVSDVDLERGIITIREGKFRRERLVPVGTTMQDRLKVYASAIGCREDDATFFPAPDGGPYSKPAVYTVFRKLLRTSCIPHGGRGRGPRIHDLRHTFAVHCLVRWYRQRADLMSKLPYLSTYMGHFSLMGTQRYLRLTPEVFPDIVDLMERFAGPAIPRRTAP
jgi:integrase/recombinase XerD